MHAMITAFYSETRQCSSMHPAAIVTYSIKPDLTGTQGCVCLGCSDDARLLTEFAHTPRAWSHTYRSAAVRTLAMTPEPANPQGEATRRRAVALTHHGEKFPTSAAPRL